MDGARRIARYSFVGFAPELTVTVKNGVATLRNTEGDVLRKNVRDPLSLVKKVTGKVTGRLTGGGRFIGGSVGYVSYDTVRYWEKLPDASVDDTSFPDLQVGVYSNLVVFDHISGEVFYICKEGSAPGEVERLVEAYEPGSLSFTEPKSNMSRERYEELVEKAKGYIESGDVFQVVLSRRYDLNVKGDLTRFYMALRSLNPSPYMYFLKMGKRMIIGSSPETLVRVEGRTVETFPIAGTRAMTGRADEDDASAKELLSDPKERAEHVMLVDLARNDIGKVSRFGSVHVPEFMTVHRYSYVQHIVSRVAGELRDGCDCYDAMKAAFPAGTVSGAPKVRAMEIIEELEPSRRGAYAGGVGYFSFNGNMDFAITIRTLVAEGGRCTVQVGAGVVADSIPEREWLETEYKAKALMRALELAEGS